jgi:peptidoglycan/xylan/chitin deacetylase (PgdA/CDA1 family)
MRSVLRSTAERALVSSGLPRLSRSRLGGRGLVLAYHDVAPDGGMPAGDRSLHLPRARFGAQLDSLLETHEVVPLPALLAGPAGSSLPRVAITFDDAYRGAITLGVPELVRRGLPATIFVAPAFLGGRSFWWDRCAGEAGLDPELRESALELLRGEDHRVPTPAGAAGPDLPAHAVCAGEDELRAAAREPGITIGSHTWSHPNLAVLSDGEARDELGRSLEWLSERFPSFIPWISYPYGRFTDRTAEIAREVGYAGGLRVEGGWLPRTVEDRYRLPRLNVPAGLSVAGFRLRVAGIGS